MPSLAAVKHRQEHNNGPDPTRGVPARFALTGCGKTRSGGRRGFQPPHKANRIRYGFSRGGTLFAYFARKFEFFRSLLCPGGCAGFTGFALGLERLCSIFPPHKRLTGLRQWGGCPDFRTWDRTNLNRTALVIHTHSADESHDGGRPRFLVESAALPTWGAPCPDFRTWDRTNLNRTAFVIHTHSADESHDGGRPRFLVESAALPTWGAPCPDFRTWDRTNLNRTAFAIHTPSADKSHDASPSTPIQFRQRLLFLSHSAESLTTASLQVCPPVRA